MNMYFIAVWILFELSLICLSSFFTVPPAATVREGSPARSVHVDYSRRIVTSFDYIFFSCSLPFYIPRVLCPHVSFSTHLVPFFSLPTKYTLLHVSPSLTSTSRFPRAQILYLPSELGYPGDVCSRGMLVQFDV